MHPTQEDGEDQGNLLDTLVNDDPDRFHEQLLTAYEKDNPRHSLVDELRHIAQITKSSIFDEMADQVAAL